MIGAIQFSAHQQRLRDQWFKLVETPDQWIEKGPVGEGESQSLTVECPANGMAGVAKPGPPKAAENNHFRAAHEKIAFDLSVLAHLPVPAVVLWNQGMPAGYAVGRAISSRAFPQADKWSELNNRGKLTLEAKLTAGPYLSAMRIFHAWIGDTDRKAEHVIVDLESPPAELRVAFIDHGNALSHSWTMADPPLSLGGNYVPEVPEDRGLMMEVASYIADIPDPEISCVVTRIPAGYLPSDKRDVILKNLIDRKAKLPGLVQP